MLLEVILLSVAVLLTIPALVFFIEVLAAVFSRENLNQNTKHHLR